MKRGRTVSMADDGLKRHEMQFRQLGLTIAYYRKLKNISQEELAERAGISRTHLSNLEAPGYPYNISLTHLFDLADILEVPMACLFLPPGSTLAGITETQSRP